MIYCGSMKLREAFSHCPRCGSRELKTNSENALECQICNLNYFFNPAPAASAIIRRTGVDAPVGQLTEILLLQRGRDPFKGTWDTPGGFLQAGETLEEALQREVYEEVGIEVEHIEYFTSGTNMYEYKEVVYDITDVCFTATTSGTPEPQDDEVIDTQFVALNNIDLNTIGFDLIRSFLEKYIEQERSTF